MAGQTSDVRAGGSTAPLVLAADDNAADRRLLELAFADLGEPYRLHTVADGHEALAFLNDAAADRPHLILLDLNMPRLSGLELLATIKADERLRTIPTIVLTTSAAPADRQAAYERHANAFFRKPVDLDDFFAAIRHLYDFWFVRAELA
ncbi:Response regulator rcp1 [Paraconexibacter sp. AEG42_29]|uniref:Response regulator rcp1 n=1 Tax=Paraconexibacter sp. AEG42_29 TaxID=2997339 RepID=A0AAU7AWS0_9ACTN